MARIRSAIRRNETTTDTSVVDAGDLQIDLAARTLKKNNELLKLTSTEFNLISLFAP